MVRLKEVTDKKILGLEIIIGCTLSFMFLILIFIASFIEMDTWIRKVLIVLGLSILLAMHVNRTR